jgi:PKD repeat protein
LTQTGAATGGDGTYTYSWEMSTNGTTFLAVSGATSSTYSPGALTVTTWYRRIVKSYNCVPVISAAVKITVYNDLTAGTIGSNETICKNTAAASISQVTAPTGGNLSYTYNWQSSSNNSNWSDISGASSTSYNPGVLTDTTYYRLKVTSGAGCGTLFTSSVRIATVPYPVTAFDMSAHCFSDTVPITQNSSVTVGSIAGYMWDFGGGITSALSDPRIVYPTSGIKTVKLVTTSNFGCKDSLTKTVKVANQPVPDFTWASNCQTLNFINKTSVSCGVVTDYLWKFHDGQTSNLKDPSHFYASTGTFDVKLIITLTGGFKDSVTFQVTLHGKSVAGFSVDDKCQGATQLFSNTSTNFAASYWTFGDGTTSTSTSPSKVYASSGSYSVRLITNSASNCRDTSSKVIIVFPNPVAGYNFSNNCVGLNLSFTNTSTGAVSYVWDFADASGSTATSPTHAYGAAGNYGVKLLAATNKGCRDSITKTVTAYSVPVADFSVPNNCLNDVTSFTNTTTGATRYDWNFGDGQIGSAASPTHSYAAPGTYTVTLTASTPNNCVDVKIKTITIYPRANVSFAQSNVCIGTSMSFVNGSSVSSGTLTHLWNFGDGAMSNVASPGRVYAGPGLYNVKLVVTTNNGCKDSLSKDVRVFDNPVAAFSASNVCHNDTSKFTSQSTNAAIYQWSFGDNTVSNVSDPSHVYASVGSYVVKLVVTSANGCKDSISKTVDVYVNPVVAFDVADVCYNDSSIFKNNSSNAGGFIWDFGDNNTSALINPTHLYYTSGSYQVKLKATSVNGCVTSGTKTHIVKVRPDADIVTDDRCFGDSTPFLNGSLYAHSYNWDFGDGTGSTIKAPMHLYGSAGSFTVKLVAYNNNGCVDSTYSNATVRSLPVPSYTASNVCMGNSISFSNTSTNANTYVWTFGDGSGSTNMSPTYSYGNPGTYNIGLTAISVFGCKAATTGSVTVYHTPIADFTSANVCDGKPVSFTNNSSIGSGTITYVWDFGDATTSTATSPTHSYASAGVYTVTLTVTSNNNCTDKISKQVTVLTTPTASFNVSNTCLGSSTAFINNSTNANTYSWTFGDGSSSTTTNPSHTYNNSGTYSVTLTARNTNGCEHVYSANVSIFATPSVSFTATTVCEGTATTFTNNSSVSSGSLTYAWTFGNGSSSAATSPTHTYGGSGTFNVTLVGTTNNGCSKSYSAQVIVNAMPKSDFSMSDACINTAVAFTNKSTGGNTYNWNFGNGSSSTAPNPTFTYITSGTFTVTLTVTSANNCVAVSSRSITIYPNPVANYTTANVCQGQAMNFTNSSTGASTYRWEFGNGFVSGASNPSYTYPKAGTYNVLLTATSANGCKNDITKSVTVYSQPVADFTVGNTCFGTSASFTNLTSGTNSYTWNFGDATSSNATNPTKNYSAAGTYNVQLTAVNANNCNSSITKQIVVFATPTASFTTTDKCLGETVVMNNASTGAVIYDWNFGDNSSSQIFAPVKFYSAAGTYTITLKATSTNNCSNITTRNVTVNPNPVAAFTAAPTCTDATAAFTNSSTISSGTFSSSWLFGDGASSALASPSHTYSLSGNYLAILNVQSAFGCKASTSSVISVFDAPVADFNAGAVCLGEKTLFANTSINANSSNWTFGDGGTSALMFPSHQYATSGTFNVNLTVLGDRGCTSVKSKTVTVNTNPTAAFTAANGCQGTAISFSNTSIGANGYQWQFGSEGSDVNMNPAFTFNNPGTVSVKLTAISSQGCRNEVSKNLEVFSSPRASFGVLNSCAGDQTRFVNFSQNGNSNNWNFGDGESSANSNPSHQYAGAGTYVVSLTVNNANCMHIATQSITINALPSADFNFTQSGRDVNFTAVNATAKTYSWNFGDGSQGSAKNENHQYSTAIVQKFKVCLNVSDNNGCGSETCKEVSIDILGVNDLQSSDLSIVVYPNPNKGNFIVALPSGIGNAGVVLESLLGVQVAETSGYDGKAYPINAENLASGVYIVKVTLNGKIIIQKIVIEK